MNNDPAAGFSTSITPRPLPTEAHPQQGAYTKIDDYETLVNKLEKLPDLQNFVGENAGVVGFRADSQLGSEQQLLVNFCLAEGILSKTTMMFREKSGSFMPREAYIITSPTLCDALSPDSSSDKNRTFMVELTSPKLNPTIGKHVVTGMPIGKTGQNEPDEETPCVYYALEHKGDISNILGGMKNSVYMQQLHNGTAVYKFFENTDRSTGTVRMCLTGVAADAVRGEIFVQKLLEKQKSPGALPGNLG